MNEESAIAVAPQRSRWEHSAITRTIELAEEKAALFRALGLEYGAVPTLTQLRAAAEKVTQLLHRNKALTAERDELLALARQKGLL